MAMSFYIKFFKSGCYLSLVLAGYIITWNFLKQKEVRFYMLLHSFLVCFIAFTSYCLLKTKRYTKHNTVIVLIVILTMLSINEI